MIEWEGSRDDRDAAAAAQDELADLLTHSVGDAVIVSNEFSEAHIVAVDTRNGRRVLIQAPKSGQWVTLDPLELEALTWQSRATFSAMVGMPFESLYKDDDK